MGSVGAVSHYREQLRQVEMRVQRDADSVANSRATAILVCCLALFACTTATTEERTAAAVSRAMMANAEVVIRRVRRRCRRCSPNMSFQLEAVYGRPRPGHYGFHLCLRVCFAPVVLGLSDPPTKAPP